jgi:acetolactate synthase-1/2/3 large subunit
MLLVIVGGGCRGAEKEVKKFLTFFNADFVVTWGAKDMFEYNYPGLIGEFGITGSVAGNKAVQECGFLIVLGSRLDTHQTGSDPSKFAPNACKLVVDIDPDELNKNNGMKIDLPICMDIKEYLRGYR